MQTLTPRRSQMITVNLRPVRKRNFILHWLGGRSQTIIGYGVSTPEAFQDALARTGIPKESERALHFWEEVPAT